MKMNKLSHRQNTALIAFADAFLPPIIIDTDDNNDNDKNTEKKKELSSSLWNYQLSNDIDFINALRTVVEEKLSLYDQFIVRTLLLVLSTSIGTSLIFGHISIFKSFAQFPIVKRTELVQNIQYSKYTIRKIIYNNMKQLILGTAFSYTRTNSDNNNKNKNPFWDIIGYPGPPTSYVLDVIDQKLVNDAMQRQQPIIKSIQETKKWITTNSNNDNNNTLECDIIIVGSGSGGCVAARVLAEAGYDVIIIEKGTYRTPTDITLNEIDGMDLGYDQHGFIQTKDCSVLIMAGSGLGGGTSINWSCCLPLPDYVKEEWANIYGLKDFISNQYNDSLQYIMDTIGASNYKKVIHNNKNQKLINGCNVLKYKWETTGQNLNHPNDVAAGYIGLGDRYGNKEGGIQAFLIPAAKHNAKIIDNCHVHRIITEKNNNGYSRATGVECQMNNDSDKIVKILARKAVIVAAGSLHTPCILHKSGLRNKHIGKNLKLHPGTGIIGNTSDDEIIDSVLGAPMTTVCTEFANTNNNNGYGFRIECPVSYPGIMGVVVPWTTPTIFRNRMERFRHLVPFLCLQRDSGSGGCVKLARDGKSLIIDYTVNKQDRDSMKNSIKAAINIMWASGVNDITALHVRDKGSAYYDNDKDKYMDNIDKLRMDDHEIAFLSAHQMGTCRMSVSPNDGVVDPNGECWECDNLYVMDASVFPTASGSNPMVTTLTIAHMLSTRLNLTLKDRIVRKDNNNDENNDKDLLLTEDQRKTLRDFSTERKIFQQQLNKSIRFAAAGKAILPLIPVSVALIAGWYFRNMKQ